MIAEAKPGETDPAVRDARSLHKGRTAARLAAVQALYQIELGGMKPDSVIAEFVAHRLDRSIDGERRAASDRAHFIALVQGVDRRAEDLDTLIGEVLAAGWTMKRLGALLRALMRAAAFELLELKAVPYRVVIDEYVALAASFFSDREPAFVNGALDKLAQRLRPAELGATATGDDGPGQAA
jgi:N utilization substance protein B